MRLTLHVLLNERKGAVQIVQSLSCTMRVTQLARLLGSLNLMKAMCTTKSICYGVMINLQKFKVQKLKNGDIFIFANGKLIRLTPRQQDMLLAELQVMYHERCMND